METGARSVADKQVILELSYPGEAVVLPPGKVLMGRGVNCFIRVSDPLVSRRHVELQVSAQVTIIDLGSHNGTCVNGKRLEGQRTLEHGDRIQLGSRTFTLRIVPCHGYEEQVTTPTAQGVAGTLRGVAVIQQTCSVCGSLLPIAAHECPQCAESWRSAEPGHPTEPAQAIVGAVNLRRHPRYPITLPIRYTSPTLTLEAVALDLSLGGVFIASNRLDELASACTVLISSSLERSPTAAALRSGRAMAFRGFVRNLVHRGRTGMGIEFDALDDRQRAWIAEQTVEEPD